MHEHKISEKRELLLVEDEAITAMNLRLELKLAGYPDCRIVSAGEQAITEFEQNDYSLILMDIGLAGNIDGLAAAEIIRESSDIPIIFMTGYQDDICRDQIHTLPNTGCIIKPIKITALVRMLQDFLPKDEG